MIRQTSFQLASDALSTHVQQSFNARSLQLMFPDEPNLPTKNLPTKIA